MAEQQIEQLNGESREAYVARVTAMIEVERIGVGTARLSFNQRFIGALRGLAVGFFRHWLLLSNLFYAYILLKSMLAGPWLMSQGETAAGSWMFNTMTLLCDQVPTHSYYLFGHQMHLCQRCIAIYGAMLVGGVIYGVMRRRREFRPIQWRWLLLFSVPLLVDGLTQLFDLRESNILLRTITGGLFGFAYVAVVYPWFDAVKRKLFRLWGVEERAATQAIPIEL